MIYLNNQMKIISKFILRVYDNLILYFNKNFYCFLFNLRTFLTNKDGRISYSSRYDLYFEINSDHYYSKKVRSGYFINGVKKRAEDLAIAYNIDKIKFNKNDIIVDCGANSGDLMNYFNDITYIGIEAIKHDFKALNLNLKKQNFNNESRCINEALWSDDNKELDFYEYSEGGDSSFFKPNKYNKIIKVKSKKLSSLLDNSKKYKLLKIDGEGAEPEILYGSESIVNQFEYITVDCGFERLGESTLNEVKSFLLNKSFVLIERGLHKHCLLFRNKNISI